MNEEKYEKLCEPFCDNYCRFPYICTDEEQLETVCENCPICKMAEEIQVHEGEAREDFAVKLISCYEGFDEKNEIITLENLKKAVQDTLEEFRGDKNVDSSDKA